MERILTQHEGILDITNMTSVRYYIGLYKKKQYESELQALGITAIFNYGIAFDGKDVLMKMG